MVGPGFEWGCFEWFIVSELELSAVLVGVSQGQIPGPHEQFRIKERVSLLFGVEVFGLELEFAVIVFSDL